MGGERERAFIVDIAFSTFVMFMFTIAGEVQLLGCCVQKIEDGRIPLPIFGVSFTMFHSVSVLSELLEGTGSVLADQQRAVHLEGIDSNIVEPPTIQYWTHSCL